MITVFPTKNNKELKNLDKNCVARRMGHKRKLKSISEMIQIGS
jgi:hypothetical protein